MALGVDGIGRLAGLLAGRLGRRAAGIVAGLRPSLPDAPALVLAPQDLRTADPVVAADIQGGRFVLVGQQASAQGRSIFEVEAPSEAFAEALTGLSWLRHLHGADTVVARAVARGLVEEFLRGSTRRSRVARRPAVVARRVSALISHAPFLIEDADEGFYRRLLAALAADVRRLERAAPGIDDPSTRLAVAIALAAAAVCREVPAGALRRADRRLDRELMAQILPDGGHVSRNPAQVIALLIDLLPLRQAYAARGFAPPPALQPAIDRMMPMLRFFRHGDGAFALFNGMGPTPADQLATLSRFDDARGPPAQNAPYSGYARVQADTVVILADAGTVPPAAHAREAHAGALAFEFSDGAHRVVVNCGLPASGRAAWRDVARASAAHSTLVVADTSSARLKRFGTGGAVLLPGPRAVRIERDEDAGAIRLALTQDGYAARFGLLHRRSLVLDRTGTLLSGEDRIEPSREGRRPADEPVALRFHLHPAVRASRLRDGRAVVLLLPNGAAWEFTADDAEPALEESVFLASFEGPRRAEQIVVHGRTRATPVLTWRFRRIAGAP